MRTNRELTRELTEKLDSREQILRESELELPKSAVFLNNEGFYQTLLNIGL